MARKVSLRVPRPEGKGGIPAKLSPTPTDDDLTSIASFDLTDPDMLNLEESEVKGQDGHTGSD